jgi:dUTP pyrophosphatase
MQLPPGTYGRIAPRSGLAVKHGLNILAGVVDPDYTGEVKVVIHNTDERQPFIIRPGYRIAQLILENFTIVHVNEVLTECTEINTARGSAGFGSTGI